jgi:hypothetical protein
MRQALEAVSRMVLRAPQRKSEQDVPARLGAEPDGVLASVQV